MRLDEDQACQIYERSCRVFHRREHPLAPRQVTQLIMGTDRMQRRALHILARAEKKRAKRLRATREKNVRPIVRRTLVGFVIRVGNDLEIYEPEVARLAKEEMEEINLFYDFYGELDEEDYNWFPNNINLRLDDDLGDF